MELEGSLEAFSLPDVLALLAMTKKTGVLRLSRAAGPAGAVRVRAGLVVAASSDEGRQALLRRIVATGLVDVEALEPAVAAVRSGSAPTATAALVRAGAVEAAALPRVARDQVTDAVFELLRWPQGAFTFSDEAPPADPADVEMAVADLVTEGQRRLEGWPALTARVPAPSTVLALTTAPDADPACSREEWGLLSLVDARRTVAELVALSGRGEWDVVSLLAGLVERGLLAPLADPGALLRSQELLGRLESGATPARPTRADLDAELAGLTAAAPAPPAAVPAPPPAPVPFAADASPYAAAGLATAGALALAAQPESHTEAADATEEDAGVDRALLLRLIAGVRAL